MNSESFKTLNAGGIAAVASYSFPQIADYQSTYSLGGSSFHSVDSKLPDRNSIAIPICHSMPSIADNDDINTSNPLKNTSISHSLESEDALMKDSGVAWTTSAVAEDDTNRLEFSDSSSDIFSRSSIPNIISSTDESYETTSAQFRDLPDSKIEFHANINTSAGDSPNVLPNNKKIANWYQQSLVRSYRTKVSHFKRIFEDTPVDTNHLLVDYACALAKNKNGLLLQGRMYITENWICFYSKIIYEQKIYLAVENIFSVVKAKTARLIPNAIQITYLPDQERYFFTSFASRERTYAILKKVWENNKGQGRLLPPECEENMEEILCQVQDVYGDESLAVLDYEDGDEAEEDAMYPNTQFNFSSSSDTNMDQLCLPIGCDSNTYRLAMLQTPIISGQRKHQRSSRSQNKSKKDALQPSSPQEDEGYDARERSLTPYRSAFRTTVADNKTPCLNSASSGEMSDGDTSEESPSLNLQLSTITSADKTMDADCGIVINFGEHANEAQQKINKIRTRRRTRRARGSNTVTSSLQHEIVSPPETNHEETKETEEDTGPVQCGEGHEHKARFYADTAINLSVDALFDCLFTDSCFFANFCAHRLTFDVEQSRWPPKSQWPTNLPLPVETPDKEALFHRRISYTLTLKQRLGPRTCTAKEHQTILLKETIPGVKYVVDAKVTNEAVPLCNCFHVVSRYCLLRRSPTMSQLLISSEVVYDRPVFFGAKSIIESTCKTSLTDNFTDLVANISAAVAYFSDEERRTGGPLAKSHHTSSSPLPLHRHLSIQEEMDAASTNIEPHKRKLDEGWINTDTFAEPVDGKKTGPNLSIPKQQTNFPYNDPFSLQADRNWLFVIALSLLLCVCLSMVYNRYLHLEKMAYRMEFTNSLRNTDGLQNQRELLMEKTFRLGQRLGGSDCAEDLETAKLLINSVSDVLTQVQSTLSLLEKRIEKRIPAVCNPSQSYADVLGE